MAKTNFDWKLAHEREDASKTRLNELAQKLESINAREANTDEEKAQLAREIADVNTQIAREQGKLGMVQAQMAANMASFEINSCQDIPSVAKQMREAIENGQRFEIKVSRSAIPSSWKGNGSGYNAPGSTTNPDVIYTEDIVKPLYEASILGKVGIPVRTGLTGNHVYPVVEAFAASVAEEGVALGDTKISTSKLYAKPERAGVAVPITRMALNETEGLLQTIFTEYAPQAVAELQNKIICSTTAVNKATNLVGPFVSLKSGHALTYAKGGSIAAKDLQALIAKVASTKVQMSNCGFLMNIADKGNLEINPMWSGAAKAVIEDNKFAGIPVVACTEVPAGTVFFGDFKYYPLDIFGDFNILIDPYSQARKGAVDCILDFAMAGTVLRQEAFAKLTEATA